MKTIGVIGAGQMGSGIAQTIAQNGVDVLLTDRELAIAEQARGRIEQGLGEMRCVHLTEKPTLRWYAQCCDTPLFNTFATGKVPYVTTLVGNCDEGLRTRLLGEPIGHLFVDDDPNDVGDVRHLPMATLMRHFFIRMVKDILSGDRRRSPLFDPRTLEPIVAPARTIKDPLAHVD